MQDRSTKGSSAIAELEQRIADLWARLPKHSVPTSMALELDALEDELERMRNKERLNDATKGGKSRARPRV
jgi:hypothetical protein